jgi:hypothetical protein
VRFVAEDGQEYCGEPSDPELDGIHLEICPILYRILINFSVGLAMAGGETVLVKVLDSTTPLDLGAAFTGAVKKATQVRDAFFLGSSYSTELPTDTLSTFSRGSRHYTMRRVELHRSRSKSMSLGLRITLLILF